MEMDLGMIPPEVDVFSRLIGIKTIGERLVEIGKAQTRHSYLSEVRHLLEFVIRDMMGRFVRIVIRHEHVVPRRHAIICDDTSAGFVRTAPLVPM